MRRLVVHPSRQGGGGALGEYGRGAREGLRLHRLPRTTTRVVVLVVLLRSAALLRSLPHFCHPRCVTAMAGGSYSGTSTLALVSLPSPRTLSLPPCSLSSLLLRAAALLLLTPTLSLSLVQVARISAVSVGVVYGSMKLAYLKVCVPSPLCFLYLFRLGFCTLGNPCVLAPIECTAAFKMRGSSRRWPVLSGFT
jgi:hypothetical protein